MVYLLSRKEKLFNVAHKARIYSIDVLTIVKQFDIFEGSICFVSPDSNVITAAPVA